MDIEFNSLQDLYNRLKPAFHTKLVEMKRNGLTYIKEEDIWNYLTEIKWKTAIDLNLYQMVSDVLNTDDTAIDNYLKEKLNLSNRKIYFEEEEHED